MNLANWRMGLMATLLTASAFPLAAAPSEEPKPPAAPVQAGDGSKALGEGAKVLDRKLKLAAGAAVRLTHVAGQINVVGTESGELSLQAVKRLKSGASSEALDKVRIEVEETPQAVSIKTVYGDESVWEKLKGLFGQGEEGEVLVDFDLEVPKGAAVSISTVSGAVYLRGVEGGLELHLVSGDAELLHVRGGVEAHLVSGQLEATDISGGVTAKIVSGPLSVRKLSGKLAVQSVSGNVSATLSPDGFGGAEVNTVSGNVGISIPAGTDATIHTKTVSGAIGAVDPLPKPEDGRSWNVTLGNGGPEVNIKTVSGDIALAQGKEGDEE